MLFLASLLLAANVGSNVGSAQDSGEFDCADFSTEAEAQGVYESNNPAEDPFNLDSDSDGIACEELDSGDSEDGNGVGDADGSASGNQYDDRQPLQTPRTGGPDLALLAAGLLFVAGCAGLGLSYRRG